MGKLQEGNRLAPHVNCGKIPYRNCRKEENVKRACVLLVVGMILGGGLCVNSGLFAEEANTGAPGSVAPGGVEKDAPVAVPAGGENEGRSEAFRAYSREAGHKLQRAATNLARSGTEFYVQPREAKLESGKSISMLWPGLGEAAGMFLTRLLGGIIEGVTFPIPFPNGWNPLLDE